jgi:solute:Na+ symporter, SSS family
MKIKIKIIICVFFTTLAYSQQGIKELIDWQNLSSLPAVADQSEPLGVAGAFAGISNGALIVAGGANFDKPYWQSPKVWHSDIWVLEDFQSDSAKWYSGFNLDEPIGYGSSITTPQGVVCIGGDNADTIFDKVFMLSWDSAAKQVIVSDLPDLPLPCAYSAAATIGSKIYLAGGQSGAGLNTAMDNFWMLDLSQKGNSRFGWQQLKSLPAPARAFNQLAAQHNGQEYCIYLMGGRYQDAAGKTVFLNDVYEYSPLKNQWRQRASMPVPICASTSIGIGQSRIFVFGGADGSLFEKAGELKDKHPGFNKDIFVYHTITDAWTTSGKVPASHVTTTAIKTIGGVIIPSGEIAPRVRTPNIMFGSIEILNSLQ